MKVLIKHIPPHPTKSI